jgi:hypothetical protein
LGILQQKAHSLPRNRSRNWGIGAACLQDGKHGNHQIDGRFQADGDSCVGLDTELLQIAGQSVGRFIELLIGHVSILMDHRRCPRTLPGLGLEEFVQAHVLIQAKPIALRLGKAASPVDWQFVAVDRFRADSKKGRRTNSSSSGRSAYLDSLGMTCGKSFPANLTDSFSGLSEIVLCFC